MASVITLTSYGIVFLYVCVCAFSLHRESPDVISGDKPLIFQVVLSHASSTPSDTKSQEKGIETLHSDICWEVDCTTSQKLPVRVHSTIGVVRLETIC
jgi:hypothetical protein